MNIPFPRLQPKREPTAGAAFISDRNSAFTLNELLALVATLGTLSLLALPVLGNAKATSRQLSCLNNLQQLGIASHMYVVEYQQYTGSYSPMRNAYVWPARLLGYTGGQRSLFACPAAVPTARWDTNLNRTLGGSGGVYSVTPASRFSYGINDWGLSLTHLPQLGLGGDVDGGFFRGPVRDGDVIAPNRMILLGDTTAPSNAALIEFAANLDPTDVTIGGSQRPSNRHEYLTDIVFTDGHTETPARSDVIDPAANNPWRSRWNNDNQPHNEVPAWAVIPNPPLDPSY